MTMTEFLAGATITVGAGVISLLSAVGTTEAGEAESLRIDAASIARAAATQTVTELDGGLEYPRSCTQVGTSIVELPAVRLRDGQTVSCRYELVQGQDRFVVNVANAGESPGYVGVYDPLDPQVSYLTKDGSRLDSASDIAS